MSMKELEGKVAIITGAGGGIGRATSLLFARAGAIVALVDIREEGIAAIAGEIQRDGGMACVFAMDISQEEHVVQLVRAVVERFGSLDILVNNAAVSREKPILEIEVAEWDWIMAVNLRSVFLLSREAFRWMKTKRSGKIISMGSAAGKIGGLVVGAHYAASKAGIMCFTKSLALQAAPYGINVNAVCPGPTRTALTDAWGDKANLDFAAKIPFKRYGEPEEIAEAILFLASGRSRYITGEILDVNGGLVMD
jgi:3-oxoacyl-[acyl-carrier protein] reductase